MKNVHWDRLKSDRLKRVRGVSFEEIIRARFVDKVANPSREDQELLLFEYKDYLWVVPCVEKDGIIFLKTLYPSRKYTRICRQRGLL